MLDGLVARYHETVARLRRVERRELRELRRWLEHTGNLRHVSILVFVPLLIGAVTYLSNALATVSFLVFPPLASGTFTLFADPESKYAEPTTFVGGMTLGALSGWLAVEVTARFWYDVPPGEFQVHAGAAALGIFLTGVATWALDLEEPTAFSTALLVLLFHGGGTVPLFGVAVNEGVVFVGGVALSSSLVAGAFVVWREEFYEERARYLYETTRGDDHVLVPMRGEDTGTAAMFGARIAAAHDAGKVVLLDVVEDEAVAATEQKLVDRLTGVDADAAEQLDREAILERAEQEVAAEAVDRLERQASEVETKAGVPCEVVVAVGDDDPAGVVAQTAEETNCDLLVVPYEEHRGGLSPFVRSVLTGPQDSIVLRTTEQREQWRRIMVTTRRAGDVAHAMIDFALRLAGRAGTVSVCHCIDDESRRRSAEGMLAQLLETFSGRFETRVARADVREFVERNAPNYDLVVMGASTDRSRASRFIAPPTFQRISEVDCDVAIVHRGR
jgi:nucleotide-binding universal stress UspA family protein